MATKTLKYIHKGVQHCLSIEDPNTETVFDWQCKIFSLTNVAPDQQVWQSVNDSRAILPTDEYSERVYTDLLLDSAWCVNGNEVVVVLWTRHDYSNALKELSVVLRSRMELSSSYAWDTTASSTFSQRIRGYIEASKDYELPSALDKARKVMPLDRMKESASKRVDDYTKNKLVPDLEAGDKAEYVCYHASLARELLTWFRDEKFFCWFNKPSCWSCDHGEMSMQGMAAPTPDDLRWKGHRVELYACPKCHATTRFPRYNAAEKLLDTRKGRCGEWANCFTLCAKAAGLDARMCYDFTDHVWTEVWSPVLNRWIHADSCEAALDEPLLYSEGWGKKLTYVIAVCPLGATDVTPRYVKHWNSDILGRRTQIPEEYLLLELEALSFQYFDRDTASSVQKSIYLSQRYSDQTSLLERMRNQDGKIPENINLPGRSSGSEEWIKSRGEDGSSK